MRNTAFVLIFIFAACLGSSNLYGQKNRPYDCGPVHKKKTIKTLAPVVEFIGLKPGDTFADFGASSGYYTAMMATYTDGVTYYVQDIDSVCLNVEELDKVLNYYSKIAGKRLEDTNQFYPINGTETQTNLPEEIDKIYGNKVFHALSQPDSIVNDLHSKLSPTGQLFIRDEFTFDGSTKKCPDENCGEYIPYEQFIEIMERNQFVLLEKSENIGSLPIYKFVKASK